MKTALSIVVSAVLIAGALYFATSSGTAGTRENVQMVGQQQVIDILAKGSYRPKKTIAKAGVPTVLRMNTNGTFDCSAAVRIPSMGIAKTLSQTGTTEIDLGTPRSGRVQGMCAMGMYSFEIDFEE